VSPGARTARLAAFGLALGFVLGSSRLADPGYLLEMLTFGAAPGAGPGAAARAWGTLAASVLTAAAGFACLARGDALPARPIRRGTVPGALTFGAGWALTGSCPAAVFVQLGQGRAAAVATLAGMLAGFALHRAARRRLGLDGAGCAG
jgi:hypothetical protein